MQKIKLILVLGFLLISHINCDESQEEDGEDKPKVFYLWDGKNSGCQSIFVLDKDVPEGDPDGVRGSFVQSDPVWSQGIVGKKGVILEELSQIITVNDLGQSLKPPFTISLWVSFNAFMQNQDQILLEYRDASRNVFNIFNNFENKFEANLIVDNLVKAKLVGNTPFADQGQWHHLVFIVDPTLGGAFFVDGLPYSDNSTDFASFNIGEITRATIGATSDSLPENIVNATIDDYRRFPEAISEEKLTKLYCFDGIKQYGEDSCAPKGQDVPEVEKVFLVQQKLSRKTRQQKQRN